MSLKYRDSSGTETPVAGLNGTSGELVPSVSYYQSGTYTGALPVGYSTNTVIFSEAMPDTDYIVTLSTGGSYGSLLLQVLSKTKSGFVFSALNENAGQLSSPEIKWQAFKLMTDESRALDESRIEQNTANFAPAFSTTTSYAVGDYVTYGGVLYKCTTAHTAGTWVSGHFTQVTVGGELPKSIAHINKFWEWNNNTTYTLDFSGLWASIAVRYAAQLVCYSTFSDSAAPKLHIFAVAATAIGEGDVSITDIGGDQGFSATASGHSITIAAPYGYNTAKLLY
jgi:hypothetical protein